MILLLEIGMILLALLAWIGQIIAWRAPTTAVRLGVMEAESDVEPAYWVDIRAEAIWDSVTLWTMVVAGALLLADNDAWPYFGLVGGGMFVYFAGRGVLARILMSRAGVRIGAPAAVKSAIAFLLVWGTLGLATIAAAVAALA